MPSSRGLLCEGLHRRDLKKGRSCHINHPSIKAPPGRYSEGALGVTVATLRDRFGLERVVLVGDRGLLAQAKIETLKPIPRPHCPTASPLG